MIKIENINKIWICSDPHYNHKNLCRGVSNWSDKSKTRDFRNLEEMNNSLISNINNSVKSEDILFCLGDWSFGGKEQILKFRESINCQSIHLILGNHDKHIELYKNLFKSINNYLEIEIDNIKFVLSHYPMASWNGLNKGWIHLFGHCHLSKNLKIREGKSMDVGFDGSDNFSPYNLSEVVRLLSNQPISGITIPKNIDHHQ